MKSNGGRWAGLSAAAVVSVLLTLGVDAAAQDTKKASPAKAASPCKGLDEKSCKGKTAECAWIAPKKGKQKAYCRLKPATKKT